MPLDAITSLMRKKCSLRWNSSTALSKWEATQTSSVDSRWILGLAFGAAAFVTIGSDASISLTQTESNKSQGKNPNKSQIIPPWDIVPRNPIDTREVAVLTNPKGRIIILVGAVNHSAESSQFVSSLIQQVKPQAVFIDINQHVFNNFGIRSRVEQHLAEQGRENLADTSLWKNLQFLPQIEGNLLEIPDDSKTTLFSSLHSPVSKSIQAVFGQLRFAGVNSGDKVDSWTHIVQALVEGLTMDAAIVLGGRDHEVGVQRGDEVMQKCSRKAAADLVYLIRPAWNEDASARTNFNSIRQVIQDKLPLFEKVVFQELDAHAACKLHQLDQFESILAVVMMIHLDGVEHELKKQGWFKVSL